MPFELYKKMIEAYKAGDEAEFVVAARNWIESETVNPFEYKEAAELFFNAKRYCRKWRNGGIDCRSSKQNMIECARKIADIGMGYPYDLIEKENEEIKDKEYKKQLEQQQEIKKQEEQKIINQENLEDSKYVLYRMVESYNKNDDANFKQLAVHLMEITLENPFAEETSEFYKFEEMKEVYLKHNMRRLHILAGELCQIINYTEVEPLEIKKVKTEEPKKILGVPDEEKKSWFKFLHPWR